MSEPRPVIHKRPSKAGMSLLEVILAIAVAGFVLAAAVSLLVSVSTIWSERAERHFFVDHVDGVTEFLNATLASAGVEISSNSDASDDSNSGDDNGNEGDNTQETVDNAQNQDNDNDNGANSEKTSTSGGLVSTPDDPIKWTSPPGFSDYQDPLLNFQLPQAPPLLVGLENAPVLGIDAFLYFEQDEGLSLLWYSILQEETEDINDLRRTSISTLVKDIKYIYWDESFEKWEEEDEPKEGDGDDQYLLPRFIKLEFEYEGETQQRTLTIPVPSKSALIF